jgi:glycosyltransferase involved in cell wall biosynthesis
MENMVSLKNGEKLRVLRIAHSSLTPSLRDRERALARSFPGIDLEVLTTTEWREAEVNVKATPDDLFPVRSARPLLSSHIQLFAYNPKPLVAALRSHRPHLIDMNHEPYSVACAEIVTLRNWLTPNTPIVMQTAQNIVHNYPPPFRQLEQRAFRNVDAAYVCSETVREVLEAKGFNKPVHIIPFGVNTSAFRPSLSLKRTAGKGPTIGFVGRMLPGKGLNVLAEALTKLGDLPWQLLVVGDGPERDKFNRSLADAGLLNRVRHTGAISYDLVPLYFHQLDVLVIPTQTTERIREQFGRVIVEAMASGVPVIGSTCGAIPEVIGDAGLVFPEGDADSLASCLRRALGDKQLREHCQHTGRQRVEQNYSWEKVAEQTYQLYSAVLRKDSSRSNSDIELAA